MQSLKVIHLIDIFNGIRKKQIIKEKKQYLGYIYIQ